VIDLDILVAFQIRDRAGDLQYAVKGAGRKTQFIDGCGMPPTARPSVSP